MKIKEEELLLIQEQQKQLNELPPELVWEKTEA